MYRFRLSAVNTAGPSDWSECAEAMTPAAPPGAPGAGANSGGGVRLRQASSTSLAVAWSRPNCNGEPVTHYVLDPGCNGADDKVNIQLNFRGKCMLSRKFAFFRLPT